MNIKPNIPINPRNSRKSKPYNIRIYKKMRSAVERFFAWLKSFRRIILRYEKIAIIYIALIKLDV
ncbi:MAG: transposase, partial [Nitrososphaeria archaeon]